MQRVHQQYASESRSPSTRDSVDSPARDRNQTAWQDLDGIPVQCNARYRTLIIDGCWIHFTPLEFEIIAVLLQRFGRGVSPEDIYHEAFGGAYTDDPVERRLLYRHIKNARPKLEAHGLTITPLQRKRGYVLMRLPDDIGIRQNGALAE